MLTHIPNQIDSVPEEERERKDGEVLGEIMLVDGFQVQVHVSRDTELWGAYVAGTAINVNWGIPPVEVTVGVQGCDTREEAIAKVGEKVRSALENAIAGIRKNSND